MDRRLTDRQTELEGRILAHLAAHPDALDSLPGIARFWCATEGDVPDPRDVEAALSSLLRSGHVSASKQVDGRIVYRRGPRISGTHLD